MEEDMVDLLLAKRFIQGQIGVIQTEDELLAEVVNLGRRRPPDQA
jgi:flagellar basal body rod protein FlgG